MFLFSNSLLDCVLLLGGEGNLCLKLLNFVLDRFFVLGDCRFDFD